ncbi:MAG: hypothetical protein ABI852_16365 [Gemmatimonadaceae bacterium]
MLTHCDRAITRTFVAVSLFAGAPFAGVAARSALMEQTPIAVDVQFSLVTPDNTPVARAPVRLVLADASGWQAANAGTQFVTDNNGRHQINGSGSYVMKQRKMPTNFWSSLTTRAESVQHFTFAAELPYVGKRWLYVVEVDHFKSGASVQMDVMRIFGADAAGNFTVPVKFTDGEYSFPGLPGKMRVPGHDVAGISVEPDATGSRWKVKLSFRRFPEPIVR